MQFTREFRTNRGLFSNQYLDEHLSETDRWQSIDSATLDDAYDAINELWERERSSVTDCNESQLEETFIRPIFQILGVPFETGKSADYEFFQSDEAARNACSNCNDGGDFSEETVAIAHTRRWDCDLDTRGERDFENPSYRIYESLQDTPTAWGVLTNGRYWRLYNGSDSHEIDTYYEIDLPAVLESDDIEVFTYFYLFFRHEAFLPDSGGDSFLDDVYSESDVFSEELGEDLRDNIHEAIETLAEGFLADNDLAADDLERIYDSSIVYLYRLICILYAESGRDPVNKTDADHSLSMNSIKQEVIEELERDQPSYHPGEDDLWNRIDELFRLIDGECVSCESPKRDLHASLYNSGLFRTDPDRDDSREARFLATHRVDDAFLAHVIELLTRSRTRSVEKTFIDYSSLDVYYLGRVYENLLAYELNIADETLSRGEEGDVYLTTDSGERKTTGSYYTPEYVVEYIVENTLEPLIDDIRDDVIDSDIREDGSAEEFTQRVFELNVLDPAMGCGTFLIRAIEYLSRAIIAQQGTETVDRSRDINWARRQVIQHCVYGVDRNPLAVEIAKVSLWLRVLDPEQPPVCLDHHLKTGNSLVGSDVALEGLEPDSENNTETRQAVSGIEQSRLEAMANVHTAAEFGLDLPDDAYERMARAVETELDEAVKNDAWETIEAAQWFQDAQHVAAEDDYFHWKLEFPDVFCDTTSDRREGSGFDAVIGNPPYVRIQNITKTDPATVAYLENAYETTHQNYDLTVPFTERGYELLREGGVFGYIETKKWIQGEYGEKLREYLVERRAIRALVDFGDQQLFRGANTYTVLLFLRKCPTDTFQYANVHDLYGNIDQLRQIQTAEQFVDDTHTYRESFNNLGTSPWVFTLPEEREILNDIERHPSLKSISGTIFVGLQTSADSVYIVEVIDENSDELRVHSNELDQTRTIEKGVTRPILRGKDIEKWTVRGHEYRVIFPYRTDLKSETYDLLSKRTLRREYPNTWRYLNENKSKLLGRADVYEEKWWGYPYPKNLEKFGAEKLMTQVLANQSSLAIDREGTFAFVGGGNAGGYGVTIEDGTIQHEALLALLNSTLLEWKLKKESSQFRGGYYSYAKRYIEKLPICLEEMDAIVSVGPTNHTGTVGDTLADLSSTIIDSVERRRSIDTHLLDYLGSYDRGTSLGELSGCQLPPAVGDSVLVQTTEERNALRMGDVDVTRDGETVVLKASARYKPESERSYTTDRWGYRETDPIPALEFNAIDERERVLINEFVPCAVDEAGGFADFYETATVTNSLVDRLQALTLPALDDVSKQLEEYVDAKDRARELEQTISEAEEEIDSIVYELYDIDEEQRSVIESDLNSH
jgi:type I restriction-modification system DNA methylase subunit